MNYYEFIDKLEESGPLLVALEQTLLQMDALAPRLGELERISKTYSTIWQDFLLEIESNVFVHIDDDEVIRDLNSLNERIKELRELNVPTQELKKKIDEHIAYCVNDLRINDIKDAITKCDTYITLAQRLGELERISRSYSKIWQEFLKEVDSTDFLHFVYINDDEVVRDINLLNEKIKLLRELNIPTESLKQQIDEHISYCVNDLRINDINQAIRNCNKYIKLVNDEWHCIKEGKRTLEEKICQLRNLNIPTSDLKKQINNHIDYCSNIIDDSTVIRNAISQCDSYINLVNVEWRRRKEIEEGKKILEKKIRQLRSLNIPTSDLQDKINNHISYSNNIIANSMDFNYIRNAISQCDSYINLVAHEWVRRKEIEKRRITIYINIIILVGITVAVCVFIRVIILHNLWWIIGFVLLLILVTIIGLSR